MNKSLTDKEVLELVLSYKNKRYGHEFLKWIDNFQLSLGLLFMFVYEDEIKNLIPKASQFTSLTSLFKSQDVNDFKGVGYE